MIRYEVISSEKMQEYTSKLQEVTNENGISYFKNFHYFSSDNTMVNVSYDHFYIVAFNKKQVVGVIKFSHKMHYEENLWSISWIDVHDQYRQRGIARGLIEKLNEALQPDMVVVSTRFSAMGQIAKLPQMMMELITNARFFINEEEYLYSNKKIV